MKPILNQLYIWDGNKTFDSLSVKDHPSGYRYAKNIEIDDFTKTLILITKEKYSIKKIEGYFKKSRGIIAKDDECIRLFKSKTGDKPVPVNVPSI